MSVEKNKIVFEGDASSLTSAINSVKSKLGELEKKEKSVENSTSSLEGRFTKFAGALRGLVPAISAAALVGMGKAALESADKIDKAAISLGATAEQIQRVKYAADLSSVSFEQLTLGMKALSRRAQEAALGNQSYAAAFERIGISVREFLQLNPEQKILVFSEAIKNLKDENERLAVSDTLAGDAGRALIPLFEQGADAVAAMGQEAEKAGLILSTKMVKDMVAAGDETTKATKQMQASFSQLTAEIAPFVTDVAKRATYVIRQAALATELIFNGVKTVFLKFQSWYIQSFATFSENVAGILSKFPEVAGKAADISAAAYEKLAEVNKNLEESTGKVADAWQRAGELRKQLDAEFGYSTETTKNNTAAVQKNANTHSELQKIIKRTISVHKQNKTAVDETKAKYQQLVDIILGRTSPTIINLQNQLKELDAAYKAGKISVEDYTKATEKINANIAEARKKLVEAQNNETKSLEKTMSEAEKRAEKMKSIAEEAAMSMELSFETYFFDAMHGKFDNLLQSFVDTIDRMVARALAADLANALGLGGEGGGFFGSILGSSGSNVFSSIGNYIGGLFAGANAEGGFVPAGQRTLVGERGPETFIPTVPGVVVPNGGAGNKNITVNMTVNANDANSFRKSQRQIVAELTAAVNAAARRDL